MKNYQLIKRNTALRLIGLYSDLTMMLDKEKHHEFKLDELYEKVMYEDVGFMIDFCEAIQRNARDENVKGLVSDLLEVINSYLEICGVTNFYNLGVMLGYLGSEPEREETEWRC